MSYTSTEHDRQRLERASNISQLQRRVMATLDNGALGSIFFCLQITSAQQGTKFPNTEHYESNP